MKHLKGPLNGQQFYTIIYKKKFNRQASFKRPAMVEQLDNNFLRLPPAFRIFFKVSRYIVHSFTLL